MQSNESLALVDEWDQADFDELHPSLKQSSVEMAKAKSNKNKGVVKNPLLQDNNL